MEPKKTILKIFRYHSGMPEPEYQSYDIPWKPDLSVLKALFFLAETVKDAPSFRRYHCNRGYCAACVMTINGRMRRACTTPITEKMTLEPAYGYPVIRDLVVDFGKRVFSPPDRYFKIMEGSMIFQPPPALDNRKGGPRFTWDQEVCKSCSTRECWAACWLNRMENLEDRYGRRMASAGHPLSDIYNTPTPPVTVCSQCTDRSCFHSCPAGAISVRNGSIRGINPTLCLGCWICLDKCTHGTIWMNVERGYAVKCNLCDGDPACVRACNRGSLKMVPKSDAPVKSQN